MTLQRANASTTVLFSIVYRDWNLPCDLDGMISELLMSKSMSIMSVWKTETSIGSFQESLWPLWVQSKNKMHNTGTASIQESILIYSRISE